MNSPPRTANDGPCLVTENFCPVAKTRSSSPSDGRRCSAGTLLRPGAIQQSEERLPLMSKTLLAQRLRDSNARHRVIAENPTGPACLCADRGRGRAPSADRAMSLWGQRHTRSILGPEDFDPVFLLMSVCRPDPTLHLSCGPLRDLLRVAHLADSRCCHAAAGLSSPIRDRPVHEESRATRGRAHRSGSGDLHPRLDGLYRADRRVARRASHSMDRRMPCSEPSRCSACSIGRASAGSSMVRPIWWMHCGREPRQPIAGAGSMDVIWGWVLAVHVLMRGAVGRRHVLRLCRAAPEPGGAGADAAHRAPHPGVPPLLPGGVARHAADPAVGFRRAVRLHGGMAGGAAGTCT